MNQKPIQANINYLYRNSQKSSETHSRLSAEYLMGQFCHLNILQLIDQLHHCCYTSLFFTCIKFYSLCPNRQFFHAFVHSDHFYSDSSSPLLLRSAPDTARIQCGVSRRSATANCELWTCPRFLLGGQTGICTHEPPVERYRLNQSATTSHKLHRVSPKGYNNCFFTEIF